MCMTGNNRTLIGFSFDDGREDNYTIAYPILKERNLPATINITSRFINTCTPLNLGKAKPLAISQLEALFEDPQIEIAGHGAFHKNSLEDILQGINDLHDILSTDTLYKGANGFASPGSGLIKAQYLKIKQQLDANQVAYVRTSLRYKSFPRAKTFIRKISRVIPIPFIYKTAYRDTLINNVDEGILYSVPVLSSISPAEILALVNLAVQQEKSLILMFHSIVPDGMVRDNWDYEESKFRVICNKLVQLQNRGKLCVSTSMDIYNHYRSTNV